MFFKKIHKTIENYNEELLQLKNEIQNIKKEKEVIFRKLLSNDQLALMDKIQKAYINQDHLYYINYVYRFNRFGYCLADKFFPKGFSYKLDSTNTIIIEIFGTHSDSNKKVCVPINLIYFSKLEAQEALKEKENE